MNNHQIAFIYHREKFPLILNREINIKLTEQQINCIFTVDSETYQKIENESIFNFQNNVRQALKGGNFKPEFAYQIQITLKPEFIPQFLANAKTEIDGINYLSYLSANQPNSELLYSENWLLLSVKQNQNGKTVELKTFWSYLPIESLSNLDQSPEKLTVSLTNFISELFENNLTETLQDLTKESLGEFTNIFKDISQPEETSLFKILINFFIEDDWTFTKIEGETSLRLGFQGQNGRWNCYAMVREDKQQMVFYSVYPGNVPEDKRLTIAEFITRANYGMIIGNFEMDFDDGEIRYKTSIDVEGDNLTFALIKQLVYPNVMTMDQYLPGIMAVMEGKLLVQSAINQIES